jgi:hypothetical protein
MKGTFLNGEYYQLFPACISCYSLLKRSIISRMTHDGDFIPEEQVNRDTEGH